MKLKNKGLFLLVSLLLLPFGGGAVPFAPLDYSAGSGALPSGWTAQPANAVSFRTAGDGTEILRLESAGGKSATLLSPRCETAGKEGILRFTVSLQSENRKGKAILYLLDSRGKVLDNKRLEMGEVREKISLSVPLSRIGEPRIVRFRIDATKDAVLQIAALKTALVPEAEAEREKTVEPKPGTMPSAWFAAERDKKRQEGARRIVSNSKYNNCITANYVRSLPVGTEVASCHSFSFMEYGMQIS